MKAITVVAVLLALVFPFTQQLFGNGLPEGYTAIPSCQEANAEVRRSNVIEMKDDSFVLEQVRMYDRQKRHALEIPGAYVDFSKVVNDHFPVLMKEPDSNSIRVIGKVMISGKLVCHRILRTTDGPEPVIGSHDWKTGKVYLNVKCYRERFVEWLKTFGDVTDGQSMVVLVKRTSFANLAALPIVDEDGKQCSDVSLRIGEGSYDERALLADKKCGLGRLRTIEIGHIHRDRIVLNENFVDVPLANEAKLVLKISQENWHCSSGNDLTPDESDINLCP